MVWGAFAPANGLDWHFCIAIIYFQTKNIYTHTHTAIRWTFFFSVHSADSVVPFSHSDIEWIFIDMPFVWNALRPHSPGSHANELPACETGARRPEPCACH